MHAICVIIACRGLIWLFYRYVIFLMMSTLNLIIVQKKNNEALLKKQLYF